MFSMSDGLAHSSRVATGVFSFGLLYSGNSFQAISFLATGSLSTSILEIEANTHSFWLAFGAAPIVPRYANSCSNCCFSSSVFISDKLF